jgi:hypothetical protein
MKAQRPRIFETSLPQNQLPRPLNRSDHSCTLLSNITKEKSQEIYNQRRKNSTLLQNLMPNTYGQANGLGKQPETSAMLPSNLVSKVSIRLVTKNEGTGNLKVNRMNPAFLPSCLKANVSTVSNYSTSPSLSSGSFKPYNRNRETQYNRSYQKSKAIFFKVPNLANTLAGTRIMPLQRTKMVNWLVEVIANYPEFCDDHTFFRTILLIDLFCKAPQPSPLENRDVCLIGIIALFIASKYEDVHSIPIEEVVGTIGHSEYTTTEILEKESEILHALNFMISHTLTIDIFHSLLNSCPNSLYDEYREQLLLFGTFLLVMASHEVKFNNFPGDVMATSVLIFILRFVDLKIEKSLDFSYHSLFRENSLKSQNLERGFLNSILVENAYRAPQLELCVRELRTTVEYFDQLFPKCGNVAKYYSKYQMRILDHKGM